MMDKRLTQTQKVIYGFIAGFHVSNQVCYASRAIQGLISEGWIEAMNAKGSKRSLFCKHPDKIEPKSETGPIEKKHETKTVTKVAKENKYEFPVSTQEHADF